MRATAVACVLGLGVCHCAARAPTPTPATGAGEHYAVHELEPAPAGQLPDGVTPLGYALTLTIQPGGDRFQGEVDVRVRLDAARDALWMHGHHLDVTSAEVRAHNVRAPARWTPSSRDGLAALRWDHAIGPGEVTLHLVWSAPFNRHLEGLYRVDNGGDAYAFTQFEAIRARHVFPCFDEPRFKTPFDIALAVDPANVAVTNTPEVSSSTRADGLRVVRFAPTEPLPTYLLAFAVGPLEVVEAPPLPPNAARSQPIPLRGVAARGRGRWLRHALDATPAMVASMEDYFHRAYPYPKLDLIAVPDFGAGAMENAGAITFRESALLVRPDAPPDQIRGVDAVIAHELAHHWFGDLVTLRWWDDLWLNESFATWMGTRTTERVFPAHRAALGLVAGAHGAMSADALSTAVPVRRPIESDDDLRGGSSAIVYQKGAAVLGMFEQWLGEDAFRDALRQYLAAHAHGVATATDLFQSLAQAAGDRPLEATMRGFIERAGVPWLAVDLACDARGRRVTVSQRRFALPAGRTPPPESWTVPLCVRFPDGAGVQTACGVVDDAHTELSLGAGACPAWVMPNADARGYFRWTLPPARLRALVAQGWARLTAPERLSVVNNARAAFTAGALDAATLRPVVTAAARDAERLVAVDPLPFWTRAIEDLLPPTSVPAARREASRLYAPVFAPLGWSPRPDEPADRALLRRDLAGFLGLVVGDPGVRAEGARRGAQWLGVDAIDPTAVPPELAGAAVAMYLRTGGDAAAARVIARALASEDAVVRFRLLGALGHAEEPALTARALPLSLDPRLRVNEVFSPFGAALDRGAVRAVAFDWFASHADALLARVSPDAVAGLAWFGARFCRRDDQARVRDLFGPRVAALPGSAVQLDGALEAIAVCAAERDTQSAGLAASLRAR